MYHVYVLCSDKNTRTYVGQTDDLDKRLRQHNAGYVRSTKAFKPWSLLHTETYGTRSEAIGRERWFKSPAGRKMIASLLGRVT